MNRLTRHFIFAIATLLYVIVIAQNWAVYTAALALAIYVRHGGRLQEPVNSTRF